MQTRFYLAPDKSTAGLEIVLKNNLLTQHGVSQLTLPDIGPHLTNSISSYIHFSTMSNILQVICSCMTHDCLKITLRDYLWHHPTDTGEA